MNDISQLIDRALSASGADLEECMDSLCSFVKEHEGEQTLLPLEEKLHEFCKYLVDDNGNVDGCTISVFRRVSKSQKVVDKLVTMANSQLDARLIEALSLCDSKMWNSQVEKYLRKGLSHQPTRFIASQSIYRNSSAIRDAETLGELSKYAKGANRLVFKMITSAMVMLVKEGYVDNAEECLKKVFAEATDDQKTEIFTALKTFKVSVSGFA